MALENFAGGFSQQFLSTLEPLLEEYNISKLIYRNLSDQKYNAYMLIKELGWQKEVDQIEGHHFEEYRKLQTLLVETTASAAGAGLPLVVDLDPTMFSNGRTYARQWFKVYFTDNKSATITNVDISLQQMTLVPSDSTYTISVTAGDELRVGDSNFGEGTKQPTGIINGYPIRNFFTQILKENYTASGTAMTNLASVDIKELAAYIKNAPAELGNTLVASCQAEIDFNMTVQIANMIWWSEENDNQSNLVDSDSGALQGRIWSTKGINQAVDALGQTHTYPVGTLSISDFDILGDLLDQQMVSPETPILWRMGRSQYTEWENLLAANNAINWQAQYTKEQLNGKIFKKSAGKEVFFNYRELTKSNYTFMASVEPTFTDPRGAGAPNYTIPNLGFMIPMSGGKDMKDGSQLESLCIRYKKLGGINRMMGTWSTDWTNDPQGYDITRWQLRCNLGLQLFGVNRMIKLQGT